MSSSGGSSVAKCVEKFREDLSNPNTWHYAKKILQAFETFETEACRSVPNISKRELIAPLILSQQGFPTWRGGMVELIKSYEEESLIIKVLQKLRDTGINLDLKDEEGQSLLSTAVNFNRPEISKFLMDQGADIRVKNHLGETLLHRASTKGMDTLIPLLIQKGIDVNDANNLSGETPLHQATQLGQNVIITTLLKHGANLESKRKSDDYTPLLLAVARNNLTTSLHLFNLGARPQALDQKGNTLFHTAISNMAGSILNFLCLPPAQQAKHLQDSLRTLPVSPPTPRLSELTKLDAAALNHNGDTPLFLAAKQGQIQGIEALLLKNVPLTHLDEKNNTFLHHLANSLSGMPSDEKAMTPLTELFPKLIEKMGLPTLVQLLNHPNDEGETPLSLSAKHQKPDLIQLFQSQGAVLSQEDCQKLIEKNLNTDMPDPINTPEIQRLFLLAMATGNRDQVRFLLKAGFKLLEKDKHHNTYLQKALDIKNPEILQVIAEESDLSVSTASPLSIHRKKGSEPGSLFHVAAFYGWNKLISTLLEKGAKPLEVKNYNGETPIHFAVESGQLTSIQLLLNKASSIEIDTLFRSYISPFQKAIYLKEDKIVDYFLGIGANPNGYKQGEYYLGKHPLQAFNHILKAKDFPWRIFEKLIEAGANLNEPDSNGESLIHEYASVLTPESISLFLSIGVDLKIKNRLQQSLLHLIADSDVSPEVVKSLVNLGLDCNAQDAKGSAPLHLAAEGPYPSMVKALLENGALVNAPNAKGFLPIEIAAFQNRTENISILLAAGAVWTLKAQLFTEMNDLNARIRQNDFPHRDFSDEERGKVYKDATGTPLPLVEMPTFIEALPSLFTTPIQHLNHFFYNISFHTALNYHPHESELLLLLNHPDLWDRDPKKTKHLTETLTSITRFSDSGVTLSDGVVKAWGDIGFLAHGFRFWRFDTINSDKSLLAQFGFRPIPPRETDGRYGKGFLYHHPETNILIEFRRGYLLVSDPTEGGSTLIIRNASPVFGRDTLRHAAYYLPRALTPKELETFNPQFLKEENSILHKNWYRPHQPDGTPWKEGPSPADKIQKLTQALMDLKEDYARFKLDTQAFEGYGKGKTFTGHLSPGLPMILKQALEWAKTPLTIQGKKVTPDLAFVHPRSPIWAPYERLSLKDPKIILELQSFLSGQWTPSAYPNSLWMHFLRTGVEKRAELVFMTPEILPTEAPQAIETSSD